METIAISHQIKDASPFAIDIDARYEYFAQYLLSEYDKYLLPKLINDVEGYHVPAESLTPLGLAIHWNSYFGHEGFILNVKELKEAAIALDILAKYDAHVFSEYGEDYSNHGGLVVCESNSDGDVLEWNDWYSPEGETFDEYISKLEYAMCECDNTHEANDTVCEWCYFHGRRKWLDPDIE